MTSRSEAAALSLVCTSQIRTSLASLKRDVALSFRICKRDFGVLGNELVDALRVTQERERAAAVALDYERNARRKAQAKAVELQGPVRVMCRVRSPLPHEDDATRPLAVHVASQQDIHVLVPASTMSSSSSSTSTSNGSDVTTKTFSFERVFGDDVTHAQLYKEVHPLVVAAVEGQHACVFAYGQTGAGKTTSIHGNDHDRGLVARAAETIFELVREQQHVYDFNVTVQMVEIYNEEMYDLLGAENTSSSPGSTSSMIMPFQTNAIGHGPAFVSRRPLGEIRHSERGVYLRNVESVAVHSADDVLATIQNGEVNRTVHSGGSDDSDHSSRSHCAIMIDVQRCSHVDGQIDGGRFVVVDLAGSERLIRRETSGSGQRVREAQHINKSLAAIGDVLAALLAKDKHVPYRNSKLTHLLQESLGTDAQTLMLVHVCPSATDVSETVNTLKFASRVNHLQNANKRRSERQEMSRLQGMIATQAAQLQALHDKLASELELRRKYEKRLEEYRQEDHKRRAKDEERGRSTPSKQSPPGLSTPSKVHGTVLTPSHQQSTVSSSRLLSTPEQPFATRRWSLYARKEPVKSSSKSKPPRAKQTSAGGQENISENIMPTRSSGVSKLPSIPEKSTSTMATPVRRARRLSMMMHGDRQTVRSPLRVTTHTGSKRQAPGPSEVRSILKKQRLSLDPRQIAPPSDLLAASGASKQVSFDLTSKRAAQVGGVQLLPPKAQSSTVSALPPRQPTSLLRAPMTASRVPAQATRVAARASFHAGVASPMTRVVRASMSPSRNKPKWNAAGWR